jgi:hypothetical protein
LDEKGFVIERIVGIFSGLPTFKRLATLALNLPVKAFDFEFKILCLLNITTSITLK